MNLICFKKPYTCIKKNFLRISTFLKLLILLKLRNSLDNLYLLIVKQIYNNLIEICNTNRIHIRVVSKKLVIFILTQFWKPSNHLPGFCFNYSMLIEKIQKMRMNSTFIKPCCRILTRRDKICKKFDIRKYEEQNHFSRHFSKQLTVQCLWKRLILYLFTLVAKEEIELLWFEKSI